MKEERRGRLSSLEEALYSRNEARVPQRDRANVSFRGTQTDVKHDDLFDVPLEDIVSTEKEHPHRKVFEKIFLTSLAFVVLAGLFAGYKFFLGGPSVSEKNINILVGGPSIVSAGSSVSLDIRLENRNARSIEKAVLKIEYPENARSTGDRTKSPTNETIEIGTLGSGKSYAKQVSFVVYGKKDDVETLKTRLEYRIPGSDAVFIKEDQFEIVIGTSPIIFNVSIPRSVVSKQPFDAVVSIKSNSPDPINNVVLNAEYPFGFSLQSSEPKAYADDNVWRLGDIPAGDTKTVVLHGILEAENNEERTIKFAVSVSGGRDNGSLGSQIASSLETITISRPFISLAVLPIGGGRTSTEAGDRIPMEIRWTNNLNVPLNNAEIKAKISGVFDQTQVYAQDGGFYNSKDQSITWQQSGLSDLQSVSPGTSGSVKFSIGIPRALTSDVRNQGVAVSVVMSAGQSGADTTEQVTSDAEISFKFKANPKITAYSTRSPLVFMQRGPIPPRVNKETSYSIVITAASSFADIDEAKIVATLPPNVVWGNVVSPGSEKVAYDDNKKVIVWEIGSITAGDREKSITTQVTITPSLSQLELSPSLLTNVNFSGVDAATGDSFDLNIDDVTTYLSKDSGLSDAAGVVTK